jgi:hypothetical protein
MDADSIRAALSSQYLAGLRMLRAGVQACTDELWLASGPDVNACWQIAYHTLFFTHFYAQPHADDFVRRPGHVGDVIVEDAIPGPPPYPADDPRPLIAPPYSRAAVTDYCDFCMESVPAWVAAIDVTSPDSGFHWYPMSKLEHQLVNLRHLQHGAAQIADRVRRSLDLGVDWAGSGTPRKRD